MDQGWITVEVRLFAGAAELVKLQSTTVRVPQKSLLPAVVDSLLAQHPGLERLAMLSRWAIGTAFISEDFEFTGATTQLAMIPPVSGG